MSKKTQILLFSTISPSCRGSPQPAEAVSVRSAPSPPPNPTVSSLFFFLPCFHAFHPVFGAARQLPNLSATKRAFFWGSFASPLPAPSRDVPRVPTSPRAAAGGRKGDRRPRKGDERPQNVALAPPAAPPGAGRRRKAALFALSRRFVPCCRG